MEKTIKICKKNQKLKEIIQDLSSSPGVYLYKDVNRNVIYVGKAKNLKKRIATYFDNYNEQSDKTKQMIDIAVFVTIITTISEFDALLLESNLIRRYQPKYNIIAKDDKSPLYVKISLSEDLPRITFIRKHNIQIKKSKTGIDQIYGPFPSFREIKNLISMIRRVIPFCTQKKRDGKSCFYTHLGLCNPCPSFIVGLSDLKIKKNLSDKYRQNMLKINAIFSGRVQNVQRDLLKSIRIHSQKLEYEKAAEAYRQLESLKYLLIKSYDPVRYFTKNSLPQDDLNFQETEIIKIIGRFFPNLTKINRIECYDISHFYGQAPVGSMVVLKNGVPDTGQYRKFKIKRTTGINDPEMMAEVIDRRMKNIQWNMPDLIILDGGKGQLSSVKKTLNFLNIEIPLISLAKKYEEIIIPVDNNFITIRLKKDNPGLQLIMRIRDESHRFALNYQRFLRNRQ